MNNKRIQTFTDLIVWKEGHKLVIQVYKVTKNFPAEEIYGITSQIRRASVSVTSNIAEGFSKKNYKEKIQFYYVASASLSEVKNQLLISRDVGYLQVEEYNKLVEQIDSAHKLLNRFISTTKTFINS